MWHCITSRLRVSPLLIGVAMLLSPPATALVSEGERAPEIVGQSWINSSPLSLEALGGRVVLVEFWTYG
ncbi:MAG TPA: hypothetical protein VLT62_25045 [Candidatus Methylomirabilis sp.]|nr:hypothetical protein [Candidatus Methylomirabilis sp.]